MTSRPRQSAWVRLATALDEWTAAEEIAEGRIRVRLPASTPLQQEHVDIVMSEDDWDIWSGTVLGSVEDAIDEVKRAVEGLASPHPYLVHDLYELHPSMTETLPPDPDVERLNQLMRENGGRPIGNWYAIDRDGKDHPFPEPPPRSERL